MTLSVDASWYGRLGMDLARQEFAEAAQAALEHAATLGEATGETLRELARVAAIRQRERESLALPSAPGTTVADLLVWYREAIDHLGYDDAADLRLEAIAVASRHYESATDLQWFEWLLGCTDEHRDVWLIACYAGLATERPDVTRMAVQQLEQGFPGDPAVGMVRYALEHGLHSDRLEPLDTEGLTLLHRLGGTLGRADLAADAGEVLLARRPEDAALQQRVGEAVASALLHEHRGVVLGGMHPIGAGRILLETAQARMAQANALDISTRLRMENRLDFAGLRGGDAPLPRWDDLVADPVRLASVTDALLHQFADAMLFRALDNDAAAEVLTHTVLRADLTDPRPYRLAAMLAFQRGTPETAWSALALSRAHRAEPATPAELTRIVQTHFPERPLLGNVCDDDHPLTLALIAFARGDNEEAIAAAEDALAMARQDPLVERAALDLLVGVGMRACTPLPHTMPRLQRLRQLLRAALIDTGTLEEEGLAAWLALIVADTLHATADAGLVAEGWSALQSLKLDTLALHLRNDELAAFIQSPHPARSWLIGMVRDQARKELDSPGRPDTPRAHPFQPHERGRFGVDLLGESLAIRQEWRGWFEQPEGVGGMADVPPIDLPTGTIDLTAIQRRLGPRELFIEYGCFPHRLAIATATAEDTALRIVPLHRPLAPLVQKTLAALHAAPKAGEAVGDVQTSLRELAAILLTPIGEWLTDIDRVIIAPHGPLCGLPFGALNDGEQFLVEAMSVSVLPSAVWLSGMPPATSTVPTCARTLTHQPGLRISDADQAPLTKVFAEVFGQVRALDARLPVSSWGPSVTDRGVWQIDSPIAFTPSMPWCSPIGRPPYDPPRGFLGDVVARGVSKELIVLPFASGMVDPQGMPPTVGDVATPFLLSGARSVVYSSWPTLPRVALAFLGALYRGLTRDDVGSAVRNAQLALLNHAKYRHPHFWGGFNLAGHWRLHCRDA